MVNFVTAAIHRAIHGKYAYFHTYLKTIDQEAPTHAASFLFTSGDGVIRFSFKWVFRK
jgi:hypothetical protein